MTPTESLLFVVETSKHSLDRLVAQLEATPSGHKSVASSLSAICRDADTLSAALAKLASQHVAELPDPAPKPPTQDGRVILDEAQRFLAIVHGFECTVCGGALRNDT